MLEGVEIPIDVSEEISPAPEEKKKLEGLELILSEVDHLSQLIQQEYDSQEPHFPEEEEELQGFMGKWVAEYKRLSQAGPEHQPEALEILGMIQALLGDLPIDEELLPKGIYDLLPAEGSLPEEA